jgi:recombinational DNA repair protein RecT
MNQQLSNPAEQGKLSTWLADPDIQRRLASSLGGMIDHEAFIAQMVIAMEHKDLKVCSNVSKLKAIHDCATLGLLPTLNQVALIPYKGVIKAMPQWQGYKALMERHPDVLEVDGVLVHVSDHYELRDGDFHHTFDPLDGNRQFNSIKDCRGGYVRILYRTGRKPKLHFVPAKEIEKAQKCAETQKLWNAWWYQMALKTLYRNAYARRAVPIDPLANAVLQRVVEQDDRMLGNDPRRVDYGPSPIGPVVRNLRSTAPPMIEHEQPDKQDDTAEAKDPQKPQDPSVRDIWKGVIDKRIKGVAKQNRATALNDVYDELQMDDVPISDEDREWVEAYLEKCGLVLENAGGELFDKGAPGAE